MKKIIIFFGMLLLGYGTTLGQQTVLYPLDDPSQILGTWQATNGGGVTYTLIFQRDTMNGYLERLRGRLIHTMITRLEAGKVLKTRDTKVDGADIIGFMWSPTHARLFRFDELRNVHRYIYFSITGTTATWNAENMDEYGWYKGTPDIPDHLVWTKISDGIVEPETTDITISTDPPPADQDCTKNN